MQFRTATEDFGGKLDYVWTVSAGLIVEGQGTREISVFVDRAQAGSNVTATVEILGCRASVKGQPRNPPR
jgi:hypothetical protein